MPSVARLAGLALGIALGLAVFARDGVAGWPPDPIPPGTGPVDHETAIGELEELCGPKEPPASVKNRACLERSLAKQVERARSTAPLPDRRAAATLSGQQKPWQELTNVVCDLEEELYFLVLSNRWRHDGTIRGHARFDCHMIALREQNYFWQTVRKGQAAGMHAAADAIASHAPYARGLLSDLANGATTLLARKMPPGRIEVNATGWALGPEDLLKLAAVARHAIELADALGPRTCAAWPSLAATFSSERECSRVMSGYYIALTGLLNDGKPSYEIEVEETQ